MADYKVRSEHDNNDFVYTQSFRRLHQTFNSLKDRKGRVILIIGSPGTGKSSNIYYSLKKLDFDVYEPTLLLDNINMSSSEVFNEFYRTLRRELEVNSNKQVYLKVKEFDGVLLADKILDSEFIDESKVGISLWTLKKGFGAFYFYFKVYLEYLMHRKDLKDVNLIIQTSLVFCFRGVKYDLLTDFYFISKIFILFLRIFFEVIRISYSEDETMQIIKNNFKDIADDEILFYIKKLGCKPRFIFEALEKGSE